MSEDIQHRFRLPLRTPRLRIDEMAQGDAAFLLELLNDDGFLRYIGDRGVRSLAQAGTYIEERFAAHYRNHGFGMYAMRLLDGGRCIGTCGLVKRPALEDPDLGFALLADYRRQGLALEACHAVLGEAREGLGLDRLAAIVQPDNQASQQLLRHLGFTRHAAIRMPGESIDLDHMLLHF